MYRLFTFLILFLLIIVSWAILRNLRQPSLGLKGEPLQPCQSAIKNCASTLGKDKEDLLTPLPIYKDTQTSLEILSSIIESLPRARIIKKDLNYIHAEIRSKVFRFTDDLEVYVNEKRGTIDLKSASRIGYYDFGVNKHRIKHVRKAFFEKIMGKKNSET
ncbi:MAG: DUF1499 domain-containing protein [Chlamydiales bacterium]